MHDESAPTPLDVRQPAREVASDGEPYEGVDGVRTGHEGVDAVLTEVEGLAGLEVAEHVAVFERAHDTLRRALDVGTDA
jgi:hypothetical protein